MTSVLPPLAPHPQFMSFSALGKRPLGGTHCIRLFMIASQSIRWCLTHGRCPLPQFVNELTSDWIYVFEQTKAGHTWVATKPG